jgi:hypothetical protein
MSKLVENKQLIHIVSEVVVLFGLTYYFSQKNKKLLEHIEDLAQRVEDQEDIIQKHDKIIQQLMNVLNQPASVIHTDPTPIHIASTRSRPVQAIIQPASVIHTDPTPIHIASTRSRHVQAIIQPVIQSGSVSYTPFTSSIVEESSGTPRVESVHSEDLDAELVEELEDLKDGE